MAFTYIFKRVEKKYMLTQEQYEYLVEAIAPYMSVDRYGETEIRNIYFDNNDNELIETSLRKPEYKEKLRKTRVQREAEAALLRSTQG